MGYFREVTFIETESKIVVAGACGGERDGELLSIGTEF